MTTIPLKPLPNGAHYAILTPDDILTLKLLRDAYLMEVQGNHARSQRGYETTLETLERILKQIQ